MEDVFMGIDVGSISTKGVILTKDNQIVSFFSSSFPRKNTESWVRGQRAAPASW